MCSGRESKPMKRPLSYRLSSSLVSVGVASMTPRTFSLPLPIDARMVGITVGPTATTVYADGKPAARFYGGMVNTRRRRGVHAAAKRRLRWPSYPMRSRS